MASAANRSPLSVRFAKRVEELTDTGEYIEPRRIGRARSPIAPVHPVDNGELLKLRNRVQELEASLRQAEAKVRAVEELKSLNEGITYQNDNFRLENEKVVGILREFHILEARQDLKYLIENKSRVYAEIPHITRDLSELTLDNIISSKLQTIEWKLKEFAPFEFATTATSYQRRLFALITELNAKPYGRGYGSRINKETLEIDEKEEKSVQNDNEPVEVHRMTAEFNADLDQGDQQWLVKFSFYTLDRPKLGRER